jgi:hypothetical protein
MRTFPKLSIGRLLTAFAAMGTLFLFSVTGPARAEVIAPETEALTQAAEESVPAEAAPPAEEAQEPPTAAVPAPTADVPSEIAESPDPPAAAAVVSATQRTATEAVEKVSWEGTAAEQVPRTVDEAMPSPGNGDPQPILHEALKRRPAVEQLSQTSAVAPGSSDQEVPVAIEAQAPPTGIASGPGRDASSNPTPSFPASPPAGQPTREPTAAADDPLLRQLAGPGSEALQLLAPSGSIELLAAAAAPAASTDSSPGPGPVSGHPTDHAPLDGPQPPGFFGEATPAPGGSSFVPLAALLALLALVVVATLRRFREVPDLPAPALFVCALERPG